MASESDPMEVLASPDIISLVFTNFNEIQLCQCAAVCKIWREAALSEDLWQVLAGGLEHTRIRPTVVALGGAGSSSPSHRELVMRRRTHLPNILCLDFGRGYAKYGLGSSMRPHRLQICQPGSEAREDSFISAAIRKLWRSPGSPPCAAAIVAEPFRLAAAQQEEERRRFHQAVRRDLARWRVPRSCIVDSASLALFAHGLTDGVVVNVGFAQTFVVPVVGGAAM